MKVIELELRRNCLELLGRYFTSDSDHCIDRCFYRHHRSWNHEKLALIGRGKKGTADSFSQFPFFIVGV
jgi:hypothetical protein